MRTLTDQQVIKVVAYLKDTSFTLNSALRILFGKQFDPNTLTSADETEIYIRIERCTICGHWDSARDMRTIVDREGYDILCSHCKG